MLTLIQKYLQGEASIQEIEKIEAWIESKPENLSIFKEQVLLSNYMDTKEPPVFDLEEDFIQVKNKIFVTDVDTSLNKKKTNWYRYAAVIVILIGSALFWKLSTGSDNLKVMKTASQLSETENNQIQLKLADGSIKILNTDAEEQIRDRQGSIIGTTKNASVSFVLQDHIPEEKLVYNEIIVPKGKIFTLILSDGSKVWLNAESKLKFPQKFLSSQENRSVTLEGEAYFEISENKMKPFIVETNLMDVKVLGTRFNVSSYAGDIQKKTTLVEGSVAIHSKSANENIILKPGFQASIVSNDPSIKKQKVNAEEHIAWIHNRLLFRNQTFREISKRIERTYNVTIQNEYPELETKRFTGEFNIENIENIFKAFSITQPFVYTIDQNIITIKNKSELSKDSFP